MDEGIEGAPAPELRWEHRAKTIFFAGMSVVAGLVGIEHIMHNDSPLDTASALTTGALAGFYALRSSRAIPGKD